MLRSRRSGVRDLWPVIVLAGCLFGCEETPVESQAAPASQVEPETWFASVDGAQRGPFTKSGLQAEIDTGRVGANDQVWQEGMANWQPASDLFDPPMTTFVGLCKRAKDSVSREEVRVLLDFNAEDPESKSQVRPILARHERLIKGARGGMHEDDSAVPLFYVVPARRISRLLYADVVIRAEDGDLAAGAASCGAIARVARPPG